MSNTVSDARSTLAAALEAVLPGRVHPYRPDRTAVAAAPAVWVDRVDSAPTTVGNGQATVFDATIVVTVDGATHSAQQLRDELHAAVHDAAVGAGWRWDGATNTTFDVNADTTLMSLEAVVSHLSYSRTFCTPPVPDPVPIPKPSLVEV